MFIKVSYDYIINSLSDMSYMCIEKLEVTNKVEKIGGIKYDYVNIKEDKLIFYTNHIVTLQLEINKIDYIDFDNEVIVIK